MCEECGKMNPAIDPKHIKLFSVDKGLIDYARQRYEEEKVVKFYEIKGGVGVVIQPMTKEEERMLFQYRPFSKYAESRFGGDPCVDDVALLINELAVRCKMCAAPTRNKYLKNETCPDCDGRSEKNGKNPRKK